MLRKLTAVWAVLDVLLLAAAVLCVVLSTVWRSPDALISLVFMPRHFNAVLALGVLLGLTFLVSIPAITAPVMNQTPLRVLNALLVLDTLFATGAGTCVWLFSLCQREGYARRWLAWSDGQRVALEDKFSCCGYWNASVAGLFVPPQPDANRTTTTAPFCADAAFAAAQPGCIDPLLLFADSTLENAFSTVYGFVCITIALSLATTCIINERKHIVRFRRIDMKRGGSGFV